MKKVLYSMLLVLAIVCVACGGKKEGADEFQQPGFTPEFSANYNTENTAKADTAYMNLAQLDAANATYLALYYLNASGMDFNNSMEYANRAVECYDAAVKVDKAATEKTLEDYSAMMGMPFSSVSFEALRNAGQADRPADTVQAAPDTTAAPADVPEMTEDEAIQAVENI